MADALRADHPMTMRDIAVLMGHPTHWDDWSRLLDSVVTGEPSLPKHRGMGAFEYLEQNPEYGEVFIRGMGNMSDTETDPVVAAYDFSGFGTVVDFCGGRGGLFSGILRQAPGARGILSDPRVEGNGAAEFLAGQGVADRCTTHAGGLFDPVVEGGDAYVLKHIVHDWPEEQALQILRNIRGRIPADGRLLVVERLLPGWGDNPALVRHQLYQDVNMMVNFGGQERSEEDFRVLLKDGGFELTGVFATGTAISVVEAKPAAQ